MQTPQACNTTQQTRQELQPPDSLQRLHIKEKAPDLNIQKDAYRLSLYN